jgi:hypothetical protein
MLEIDLPMAVLYVEIAAVLQNLIGANFPCSIAFLARVPPGDTVRKFFKLNWLSLGVVLPTFGERVLVVPDVFCRTGAVEKNGIFVGMPV